MALKYVFGVSSRMSNNVHFLEEKKILYPAAHYIVKYNISDKVQQYISGNEVFRGITAMGVSSKNTLLAVGEKGDRPNIYIYDITHMRKKKFCVIPDDVKEAFEEYVSLVFFPDDDTKLLSLVNFQHCIAYNSRLGALM